MNPSSLALILPHQVYSFDLRRTDVILKTFDLEFKHNHEEINSVRDFLLVKRSHPLPSLGWHVTSPSRLPSLRMADFWRAATTRVMCECSTSNQELSSRPCESILTCAGLAFVNRCNCFLLDGSSSVPQCASEAGEGRGKVHPPTSSCVVDVRTHITALVV